MSTEHATTRRPRVVDARRPAPVGPVLPVVARSPRRDSTALDPIGAPR